MILRSEQMRDNISYGNKTAFLQSLFGYSRRIPCFSAISITLSKLSAGTGVIPFSQFSTTRAVTSSNCLANCSLESLIARLTIKTDTDAGWDFNKRKCSLLTSYNFLSMAKAFIRDRLAWLIAPCGSSSRLAVMLDIPNSVANLSSDKFDKAYTILAKFLLFCFMVLVLRVAFKGYIIG